MQPQRPCHPRRQLRREAARACPAAASGAGLRRSRGLGQLPPCLLLQPAQHLPQGLPRLLRAAQRRCGHLLQQRPHARRVLLCGALCSGLGRRLLRCSAAWRQVLQEVAEGVRGPLPQQARDHWPQRRRELLVKEALARRLVRRGAPRRLLAIDGHQLQVKSQVRVGWNGAGHATLPIGQGCWHQQQPPGTQRQLLHTLVPAPDDRSAAHLELEGVAVARGVKLRARGQEAARVVDGHGVACLRKRCVVTPRLQHQRPSGRAA
mmetsp:Transcript_68965/g.208601  ORF Transcript_68965/g.208601 Transcript_68965/m.208601 type:complete len:263 (-) Transcript_68965:672-1460(-)